MLPVPVPVPVPVVGAASVAAEVLVGQLLRGQVGRRALWAVRMPFPGWWVRSVLRACTVLQQVLALSRVPSPQLHAAVDWRRRTQRPLRRRR